MMCAIIIKMFAYIVTLLLAPCVMGIYINENVTM
jgi:hypothetical protein